MPIDSDIQLISATLDGNDLTLDCIAAAALQGDAGKIMIRTGSDDFAEPTGSYTSWADSEIVFHFSSLPSAGSYDVYFVNGDSEQSNTLVGEFTVGESAAGGITFFSFASAVAGCK